MELKFGLVHYLSAVFLFLLQEVFLLLLMAILWPCLLLWPCLPFLLFLFLLFTRSCACILLMQLYYYLIMYSQHENENIVWQIDQPKDVYAHCTFVIEIFVHVFFVYYIIYFFICCMILYDLWYPTIIYSIDQTVIEGQQIWCHNRHMQFVFIKVHMIDIGRFV